MRGVIIFGSSRSHGNTRKVVDLLLDQLKFDLIDLKEKNIAPFDYDFKNSEDDFIPTISEVVEKYDLILFATPVYWYSMSGILKNFFDRISDCLKTEKEIGRKLRGMSLAAISCGYDQQTVAGFHEPFEYSANYLGMKYKGFLHTWIKDDAEVEVEVKTAIHTFGKSLIENQ